MTRNFNKEEYQKEYYKKNKKKLQQYNKGYRKKNRKLLSEKAKIYVEKNRKKVTAARKISYQKHRKKILRKKKIYRSIPKVSERQKKYMKEYGIRNKGIKKTYNLNYYKENKDKIIEQVGEYYKKNKAKLIGKAYELQKRKTEQDPIYRLVRNLRRRVSVAMERVKKRKKTNTFELIGCSIQFLIQHIEKQFLPEMSWKNRKKWHIDHIVPVNYFIKNFDISSLEVQKVCFNYRNLRPLWGKENLKRSKLELGKISSEYQKMINNLK